MHGYIASVSNLLAHCSDWTVCAIPLVQLLEPGPDPDKAPVAVKRHRFYPGNPLFDLWRRVQAKWRVRQSYRQPGPVQFWGPGGDREQSWASYTLRAEGCNAEALEALAKFQALERENWTGFGYTLQQREEALMSPLQRWRMNYEPRLPNALRSNFAIVDVPSKGHVIADIGHVQKAFPNLLKKDLLRAVAIVPEE